MEADALFVLIPRTDLASLSLSAMVEQAVGAGAQAASELAVDRLYGPDWAEAYAAWYGTNAGARGRAAVIPGECLAGLTELIGALREAGYPANIVINPRHRVPDGGFVHEIPVATCGWAFGGSADLLSAIAACRRPS